MSEQQPPQLTRYIPGGYNITPGIGPIGGMTYYLPYPQQNISKISNFNRKQRKHLRNFANAPVVFPLIQRITRGVLGMDWQVLPPIGEESNESSLKLCAWITKALKQPNFDDLGRYREFISAIVDELLVLNECYIERQPGYATSDEDNHVFWAWVADSNRISYNPYYTTQTRDTEPLCYFSQVGLLGNDKGRGQIPVYAENIFRIQDNVNTYERNPRSALEIAYNLIDAWLGVSDYQQSTTTHASSEWILDVGELGETELIAFREYWELEVKQGKKKPIGAFGGKANAVKIGANSDAALYMGYCDMLMRVIALCFSLTTRDVNVVEKDNRATAETSADLAFGNAIRPISELVFQTLEQELVQYYFPGFRLHVNYREPRSDADLRKSAISMWSVGLYTRNEARLQSGNSPLPDEAGDVFVYDVMPRTGKSGIS